jgi:hypothetical protein
MVKIVSFDVGIVNLAYCIVEKTNESIKILRWEIIALSEKGSTFSAHIAKSGIAELYLTLIHELDKRPWLLDTDTVLIEKQPSFNPKMRIIAGCLQTYFYIRGIVDKQEKMIRSVLFFSPKNKLKCYTGPELDISSKNGKIVKGKYAQTKKMGVLIARSKLEEYSETPEWCTFFENSKKKDDLSDCYLQALTYLTQTQIKTKIPEKANTVKSKATLKKELKEYLESRVKVCSVVDLMEKNYKTIHQLENIPENIETVLANYSMKKYINLKYEI